MTDICEAAAEYEKIGSARLKVLALFGEAGSGKDFIKTRAVHYYPQKYHKIINCTTRPKRDNEEDKKDYFFLTNEQFLQKLLNCDLIEAAQFNNWHYGTMFSALVSDKINLGVFSIAAIECLLQDSRLLVQPVYVQCTDKERLIRQLNREDNPNCEEICRRFFSDKKDFIDIPFEYKILNNNDSIYFRNALQDLERIGQNCFNIYE